MTRQAADRLGVKPLASIIGKYKSSYKWKKIVITSIQYKIMIVVIIYSFTHRKTWKVTQIKLRVVHRYGQELFEFEMFQWLFEVLKVADSSPIRILHSLISLSLSSSGFADASVAPIDFPIAPAAAVPKVLYFNQFFLRAYQGGRVVSRLDPGGGGGRGVLPYMGYIGMFRCEGYGFQAVYSRIGYIIQSVWL